MNKVVVLALALASAPLAARAGEMSYTYAELGYGQTDVDGVGKTTGGVVNGSIALGERFHLMAGFDRMRGDESYFDAGIGQTIKLDLDSGTTRVGLGYHHAFSQRAHLLVQGGWQRTHLEIGVVGFDEEIDTESDGYYAEAGARGLLADGVEGWALAGVTHGASDSVEGATLGDEGVDDDEAYLRLGGQFMWNQNWGVVAEGRVGEESQQLFVGLRGTFDNWD